MNQRIDFWKWVLNYNLKEEEKSMKFGGLRQGRERLGVQRVCEKKWLLSNMQDYTKIRPSKHETWAAKQIIKLERETWRAKLKLQMINR